MSEENVILSIIIPVYNSEDYLDDLIKSMDLKNINENIEIIFVDDGSSDNSSNILKKYQANDDRIHLITQKNSGAPAARNLGLAMSNGEYIYFVDSDDMLFENTLSNIILDINNYHPDIIIGGYNEINQEGELTSKIKFEKAKRELNHNNIANFSLLSPLPGNKIFSKKMIDAHHLEYEKLSIGQDLNFYLKALSQSETILLSDKIFYQYFERENSISRTYSKKILGILDSVYSAEKYVNKYGQNKNLDFNTLKFKHFYLQFSKVPFIQDKKEKKLISDTLRKELLDLNWGTLDKSISHKAKMIAALKVTFHRFHRSKPYLFLR